MESSFGQLTLKPSQKSMESSIGQLALHQPPMFNSSQPSGKKNKILRKWKKKTVEVIASKSRPIERLHLQLYNTEGTKPPRALFELNLKANSEHAIFRKSQFNKSN